MTRGEATPAGTGISIRSLAVAFAVVALAGAGVPRPGIGMPESEESGGWTRWLVRAWVSGPARELPPGGPGSSSPAPPPAVEEPARETAPEASSSTACEPDRDPLLDRGVHDREDSPAPRFVVAGLPSDNLLTADPVGDAGFRDYVQAVNSERGVEVGVFDKQGRLRRPAFRLSDLWTSAGSNDACSLPGAFDPVVVHDHLANRWVLTQVTSDTVCVAVSTSPDPLGRYFLYRVGPLGFFPDYLKCALWPDGYYMSSSKSHSELKAVTYWVFERSRMLAGATAQVLATHQAKPFALPADLDGPPPRPGTPGLFATVRGGATAGGFCGIEIRSLEVDWERWRRTRLELTDVVATAPFRYVPFSDSRRLVPQRGGDDRDRLESGSHFPMHRLQYRRMGGRETLVGNLAVSAAGGEEERLAIRWFQLHRKRAGAWRVRQEGTYGPDLAYRFYGSAALNGAGDLAVGYSVSGLSLYPSFRYAVRAAGDPAGSLRREAAPVDGEIAKDGTPNWGDYSAMVVDPADQRTFWYTNMTRGLDERGFAVMKTWIAKIPAPAASRGPATAGSEEDEPPGPE